jgi:hypothetical protein
MEWLVASSERHLFQCVVGRGPIKHAMSSEESFLVNQLSLVKHFGSYMRAVEIRFEIPALLDVKEKRNRNTI